MNAPDSLLWRKAVTSTNARVCVNTILTFSLGPFSTARIQSFNYIFLIVVDCEWDNWEYGACSVECGGGTQPMFRIKTAEALFGGIECEGEGYGEQECNPQPCPGKYQKMTIN